MGKSSIDYPELHITYHSTQGIYYPNNTAHQVTLHLPYKYKTATQC